jgi:deazaflavin-dependent oxidoreductase (nitroreductase family)
MPLRTRIWDATGGRLLVRAGKAGTLTTVGRRSGQPRTVQCGFVRRAGGTIVVGSADGRQWPANLAAAGSCTFEAPGIPRQAYDAVVLEGEARAEALAELVRSQGGRSGGMYSGLVFELHPREPAPPG